jgi:hypothetical protein
MPVDYLKLGQDHFLQNRFQFAKYFAIWHHTADNVLKSTQLDGTRQANTNSTADCEFESDQKLTSNSMEQSFLGNGRSVSHHVYHPSPISKVHTLLTEAPLLYSKNVF